MIKLKYLLPESIVELPQGARFDDYRTSQRNTTVETDIKEYIKTHCQVALRRLQDGLVIWRGDSINAEAFKVRPSSSQRVCRNGNSNFYFLYIDTSPAWKDYPKRSYSIICSTDYSYASVYAGLQDAAYVVLFEGNPVIAWTPKEDFWGAKTADGRGVADLLDDLTYLLGSTSSIDLPLFTKKVGQFEQAVNRLGELVQKHSIDSMQTLTSAGWKRHNGLLDYVYDRMKRGISFYEAFYAYLTPQTTETKIASLSTASPRHYNEIWSEGNCVLVKRSLFKSLFPDIDKQVDI